MFADVGIMGYLHQIVELHAFPDVCGAHSGAVDTCVGTYLHVVFYGDDA